MKVTRLYTGADKQSHFEDIDIPLKDGGEIGLLSERFKASGVIFRETPGSYDYNWHNAPERQFILMMDGGVEIEIGDGSKRTFNTGDILLVEDTDGQGHISRALNGQKRKSVFITLN
jgi:quercetin dioxygenase-like cupin family protein